MDHFKSEAPDSKWDLALDIVRALELSGRYEVGVDTGNAQHVVDIRWAAHQAGRLLGMKTRVVLADPVDTSDFTGTASVTSLDGGVADQLRARQGLSALLRSVHNEQTKTLNRPVVPEPRRGLCAQVGSHVMAP
jgi:hypothetical protein